MRISDWSSTCALPISGQVITFNVYAADAQGNDFEFLWSFWGSHGWAATELTSGTSATQPDGSVRNTYEKDISGETGGDKRVIVTVNSATSGKCVTFTLDITLDRTRIETGKRV